LFVRRNAQVDCYIGIRKYLPNPTRYDFSVTANRLNTFLPNIREPVIQNSEAEITVGSNDSVIGIVQGQLEIVPEFAQTDIPVAPGTQKLFGPNYDTTKA